MTHPDAVALARYYAVQPQSILLQSYNDGIGMARALLALADWPAVLAANLAIGAGLCQAFRLARGSK